MEVSTLWWIWAFKTGLIKGSEKHNGYLVEEWFVRTASLVLGIIGGVFGIIAGFLALLFGGVGVATEQAQGGTVVGLGIAAVLSG